MYHKFIDPKYHCGDIMTCRVKIAYMHMPNSRGSCKSVTLHIQTKIHVHTIMQKRAHFNFNLPKHCRKSAKFLFFNADVYKYILWSCLWYLPCFMSVLCYLNKWWFLLLPRWSPWVGQTYTDGQREEDACWEPRSKCNIYAPFEKGGAYCFAHVGRSVGRSVCMSVSLNLVQLITLECFAPQASNLVGR